MSTFADKFTKLLGDEGINAFAHRSSTSPASVSRAKNGGDVAASNLEKWSVAFGLNSKDATDFIRLGKEAELLDDKKRGGAYRELQLAAIRSKIALEVLSTATKALVVTLDDPKNRLTKNSIQALKGVVEVLELEE